MIPMIESSYGLDLRGKEEQLARVLGKLCEDSGMDLDRCTSTGLHKLCDAAVEHMVVGESYFLRHREALEEFVRHTASMGRPNVWCAACSTGEEAYSLAFLFVQRGIEDFSILGSDVNPSAIRRAREGVYGRWSLRGLGDEARLLFDHIHGNLFRVKDRYRRNVRFSIGNVMTPPEGVFIGISCRNLFIYFSDSGISKALDIFYQRLHPKGVLLVGAAEAPAVNRLMGNRFVPSGVFVFRKASPIKNVEAYPMPHREDAEGIIPRTPKMAEMTRHTAEEAPRIETPAKPAGEAPKEAKEAVPLKDQEDLVFERAKSMADRGDLQGALEILTSAEKVDPTGAKVKFLKGVILMDMGMHKEAAESFKEAAYLDPSMPEPRHSLMILSLQEGDMASAQRHGRLLLNILKDLDDREPTLYGPHVTKGHLRKTASEPF
ncbi:methylase of chemotaxis methyl-accepting protein [Thermanaerovibrio velox DSM 12556]|uniref:Methylase of chemotaxis methyl-accepting protein n=1 Tax=Thermanaerovibrio velox DSM 12556 TaxID=926567 RepID=H0UP49_9BACT|nr:methylase of chemotaxis methyl-accepting protein [Thermanaerovibrio velox DSM 12556]